MAFLKRLKELVAGKKDEGEQERPHGIPPPIPDHYFPYGRRDDLSRFDLSPGARKDIARRRAAKEAQDAETMRQFRKSFGIDEED